MIWVLVSSAGSPGPVGVVSPVRVEIEDGAFSRVLSNPGTTPDRTGGMRLWRNVPGT